MESSNQPANTRHLLVAHSHLPRFHDLGQELATPDNQIGHEALYNSQYLGEEGGATSGGRSGGLVVRNRAVCIRCGSFQEASRCSRQMSVL